MIFFLLGLKAILTRIARVYKGCSTPRVDPCYDGCLPPFIGASGALLRLGLLGGSQMAVAWWSWSPLPSVRPWTWSIVDKGGRGGRQAADRAVLPAERAVSEVEPTMTFSFGGLRHRPALSLEKKVLAAAQQAELLY